MKLAYLTIVVLLTLMAAGCGGGGSNGGAIVVPITAKLVLQTDGTMPTGTSLGGIGISVVLPKGVTPKKDSSGNLDASVITASGVTAGAGSIVPAFTEATATTPAKLSFILASTLKNGFGTGEFSTVTLLLTGVPPLSGDFSLTDFKPVDLKGALVPGGTGGLQATFNYSLQ